MPNPKKCDSDKANARLTPVYLIIFIITLASQLN